MRAVPADVKNSPNTRRQPLAGLKRSTILVPCPVTIRAFKTVSASRPRPKRTSWQNSRRYADPNTPEAIEKRREREAIAAARAERQTQREIARRDHEAELARQAKIAAEAAAEAERLAAEQASRGSCGPGGTCIGGERGTGSRAEGRPRCPLRRTEGGKEEAAARLLSHPRPNALASIYSVDVQGHGFSDSNSVDPCGENTAGISGAFSRRVESFCVQALVAAVAADPDR